MTPSNDTRLTEFCRRWKLSTPELVSDLYDLDALELYLPADPGANEIETLQQLIGHTAEEVMLAYPQTLNAFALIRAYQKLAGGPKTPSDEA